MSQTLKILGQLAPASNTLGTVFTNAGTVTAAVSSVIVCNRGGAATTFRISAAINAAADGTVQYLYYDVPLAANDTFISTVGMTLGTADEMRAQAGNGSVTFTAFGAQNF